MLKRIGKISVKKFAIIFALLLFVMGTSLFIFVRRHHTLTDKQKMIQVLNKVNKLVLLPKNEEPTLATVVNPDELKDDFLKTNTLKGDQLLIYTQAKKVFIYRPQIGKLVSVGPISIEASATEVNGSKIKIRNGSGDADIVSAVENLISKNYQSVILQKNDTAKRSDFPYTIVIDLTDGSKYDLVSNIMQTLGAKRGVLPNGEEKPVDTDILIITGAK